MKKLLAILLAGTLILGLTACNGDSNASSDDSSSKHNSSKFPDFSGQWKQVNNDSEDSFQGAIIEDDVIEIYWVSDGGDTRSLYWSGSFIEPNRDEDEPYSWESENNKARTKSSMLSSTADTKTFTYENEQISYSCSIMGTTSTIRLEQKEWAPDLEIEHVKDSDSPADSSTPSTGGSFHIGNQQNGNTSSISLPSTSNFDADKAVSLLRAEGFFYSNRFSNYAYLVVTNNSEFNLSITANVTFYDKSGNLVGAESGTEDAVESGYETLFRFTPDEEFAEMRYEFEVSETDEKWNKCVQSSLSYQSTPAKDKVILSVTNNGTDAAMFVEGYVLFFSGENLVNVSSTYFVDNDYEIKPGKTINGEIDCYEPFDSFRVILSGQAAA